jgi:wobble nucleotide-excising tRNase
MKSTKYQLLKDDFDALCKEIRNYRERIEELEKENKELTHQLLNAERIINSENVIFTDTDYTPIPKRIIKL